VSEYSIMPLGGRTFQVKVEGEGSGSTHEVTVDDAALANLGWEGSFEELIRLSFDFLLAREPKESILAKFELSDVSRYFPEYADEIASSH